MTIMDSVYSTFRATVEQYHDRDFLHIPARAAACYANGNIDLSYGEAGERTEALKASYCAAGFGTGHRVALILQNRPDFLLHWFALNGLGCSVVPINDEMSAEEQAYIINHSEACLLVYLPDLAHKLEPLLPLLQNTIAYQATDQMESLLPPATAANGDAPSLDSECAMLYTSGSTGKPKGCVLTNEYYLLSGRRYVELGGLCKIEPGTDRLITPLPLVHMNAMACSTLAMVMSGGCLIQLDRFHPRSWWQSVRESAATIVHYLGVMPAMLLNMEPGDDDFSGQVRFAFGAGVNPKHHAPFEERFGFPLIEAWGMTETGNHGAIIANTEPRHVGTSCFGKPPGHLQIKLVDEQGQPVAPGTPGELLVRHTGENSKRGFFSEYLKNPEATGEAWEGGWFHTGDVVRQNTDGTLCFVDRRKNVIRRSGENISALEVEAALSQNPDIAMAIVCPVPDEVRGDEVMACVITAPGVAQEKRVAEQIVTRALETLAYFKVPGYIGFYDELPLTVSEKPRRAEIKALAIGSLENGECYDLCHLKKRQAISS
jgi:acyl-CoA synthetase (AMP-forming)/AMP-acid ligase II